MSTLQYAEDAAECMTKHILDRYVAYLRVHTGHASCEQTTAAATSGTLVVPESLEEALAPLEVIYGKTFSSAISIALHGAEPVIRYVEAPCDNQPTSSTAASPVLSSSATRRVYRVGEYVLYSPFYCPCSAYAFKSVRRQEVWCCKHMLALQIALRIEESGIPQDNIRERVVDSTTFQDMLIHSLDR